MYHHQVTFYSYQYEHKQKQDLKITRNRKTFSQTGVKPSFKGRKRTGKEEGERERGRGKGEGGDRREKQTHHHHTTHTEEARKVFMRTCTHRKGETRNYVTRDNRRLLIFTALGTERV